MRHLVILTLILSQGIISFAFQCPDTLVSATSLTCTTPTSQRVIDSSSFTIPSGQTLLTLVLTMKVTSYCSATDPYPLAVLTLGSSGSEKKIINIIYTGGAITVQTEDNNGLETAYPFTVTLLNNWFTVGVSVDLSAGTFGIGITTIKEATGNASNRPYSNVATAFDSTVKVSLCSNIDGTSPMECQAQNVKLIYTQYYSSNSQLALGTSPVLYGAYPFLERTGFSTASSISTMGTAYFGASTSSVQDTTNSPAWMSTADGDGLSFTATNQYVTLPTFTPQLHNNFPNSFSLGLSFWIKITEFPSSGTYPIFSYKSSDLNTNRVSLAVNQNGKIVYQLGTGSATSSAALTLSTWKQILAQAVVLDPSNMLAGTSAIGALFFGTTQVFYSYISTTLTRNDLQSTDVVKLGGFIGMVSDFRIITPTAVVLNNPSCSSACAFDIGDTNPPVCLTPRCGAGSFASGTCITCSSNCLSCTGPTLCQICESGYELQNSACVLPSSGGNTPNTITAAGDSSLSHGALAAIVVCSVVGVGVVLTALFYRKSLISRFCRISKMRKEQRNATYSISNPAKLDAGEVHGP